MSGVVVDGILEDRDGHIEELLGRLDGAGRELIDQQGEVHGVCDRTEVITGSSAMQDG